MQKVLISTSSQTRRRMQGMFSVPASSEKTAAEGMEIVKRYFFTACATGIAILLAVVAFLQGQLGYLSQLNYGTQILNILAKLDQISFLLVVGMLLTLVIALLAFHRTRRSKLVLAAFLAVFILTLLAKGKFGNIGTDSMAEVLHTNSQEAKDFVKAYLAFVNVSVKEALVLFGLLLLIPVYMLLTRRAPVMAHTRDIHLAFTIIAAVYLVTIGHFIFQLASNHYPLEYYRQRLHDATMQALAPLEKSRSGPNVVVYIGESTSKENLPIYASLAQTPDPLKDIKNDLIIYSDVVTSFSHTFPSLYRAFSISKDPYRDQFFLIKDLQRANSIAVLTHFGIETHWISNQNLGGEWDWNSELFGKRASHTQVLERKSAHYFSDVRRTDRALIQAYLKRSPTLAKNNQMMFLHSYAGHGDYCKNIPPEEKKTVSHSLPELPQKAVFGDVYIDSIEQRLDTIECYDSAMSYVSKNLRTVIDDVARQQEPVVFLYFADHGEEVFEGTGHDSRRNSFRHIEIPFFIYFNEAAKKAYPDMYRAAVANKDKPYSIEWLADSLLDVAGIASKERKLQSVFREGNQAPKRYALRRADIRGNQFILAVDDEDASSRYALISQGHDYYRKRRIYNALPPSEKNKICSYRTNSLLKYREAASIFDCVAVDITIEPQSGTLYAYGPPQKNNYLQLEDLMRFGPPFTGQMLLGVSNPQGKNLAILHAQLNELFDKQYRDRLIIEFSHFDGVDQGALRQLVNDGYKLFYALPYNLGKRCAKQTKDPDCVRFREHTLPAIERAGVQGLAFDVAASPFVRSLSAHNRLEYSVKDLTVDSGADINRALLAQSYSYSIPYDSAFDY
jgi:glucan phosphoethanolaminetransferase (alkaline phosphatase superfamily)